MLPRLLLLAFLLIAAGFAGQTLADTNWTDYSNERFGYALKVPNGLQIANRAADSSGVTWRTGTVRLQVSGTNNPYKIKPHEYFERIERLAGDGIVWQRQGTDEDEHYWYSVLFTKGGRRVHHKVFISAGSINSVDFSYGYRHREQKELLGERVIESFRPGNLSNQH